MEIRILAERDAEAWWNIRLEALQQAPFAFGKSVEEHLATPVETIRDRFRSTTENNFTLGAFESDSLRGTATFVRESGIKDRHKGRIYGVYVTPSHQGKGAGRTLIAALVDRARRDSSLEQILLAVASSQSAAKRLYQCNGFVIWGIEPRALKVGDQYVDEEHMILRLS